MTSRWIDYHRVWLQTDCHWWSRIPIIICYVSVSDEFFVVFISRRGWTMTTFYPFQRFWLTALGGGTATCASPWRRNATCAVSRGSHCATWRTYYPAAWRNNNWGTSVTAASVNTMATATTWRHRFPSLVVNKEEKMKWHWYYYAFMCLLLRTIWCIWIELDLALTIVQFLLFRTCLWKYWEHNEDM